METEITMERAIELIRTSVKPLPPEPVPAIKAHGRVLAEDVTAPMDQPPWPRSPLDGYAFHAADSAGASRETPVTLRVVDTVYAGGWCEKTVGAGQAVRLMTGAPIPSGCDCVLRQEDTDRGTEAVEIYAPLSPWQNYTRQGEDFKRGSVLLSAGTRLDANAMGILASAGLLRDGLLSVTRMPRCALICTGDELVPSGMKPLPPGKIYSSNAALLSARLSELGMELTVFRETFADSPEALAETLREACAVSDAVFTTGGVSVGARDILHEALPLLKAERVFWKVDLKPGSPLMYSNYNGVPILSLSGNPFAAGATFELFGRPLLAALAGTDTLLPRKVRAVLDAGFPKSGRRFLRAHYADGHVTLPRGHTSGELQSAAGTNCLAELHNPMPPDSEITVWLL